MLIIYQVKGEWVTCHSNLVPYSDHVLELIKNFEEVTFHHIPREENHIVYALATLSLVYKVNHPNEAPVIKMDLKYEPSICLIAEEESNGKPWYHDIK